MSKNIFTKWLMRTGFFVCAFLISFNSVLAQTVDNKDFLAKVEEVRAKEIIYSEGINRPIYDGREKTKETEDVVYYQYKGNEVDATNIIFKENSEYSNTEKINDNIYKIYTGIKYVKEENGQVREVLDDWTSKAVYDQVEFQTTVQKIIGLLKTPYAIADSYYADNDRHIDCSASGWSNVRACSSGTVGGAGTAYVAANTDYIYRYFLDFNIDIPDDNEVASSTVLIYNENKNDNETFALTLGTQNDPLVGDDENNWTDDLLSNSVLVDTGGKYYSFLLTGSATSTMIDGRNPIVLRDYTYDILNSSPSGNLFTGFSNSGTSGTNQDPYILVEYYNPTEEEETPTATSTPVLVACTPEVNNELSVITGCSISNDGTATTTTSYVYHIPFIVWIILAILMLFIGERIILEFIIRWRR